MNAIQELDLGNNFATDPNQLRTPLDVITAQQHIYKESVVQITNVISADMREFYQEIQKLPDLKYMQNINELLEHGPRRQAFENVFREYAVQFYMCVAKSIPLKLDKDYIVEGSDCTYVVILEADKPKMLDIFS